MMNLLNKIFVISFVLIPILIAVCINSFEQNVDNIVYILGFISTFVLIIYDIFYVIIFFVLKVGKGMDRISLFNRKDD